MTSKETPKVEYYYRTIQELIDNTKAPFSDPYNYWGAINHNKKEAFLNNITGINPKEICQIIALVDGVAAGYLTLYTGYALINNLKIKVQHGSDLYAHPKYRKLMIGAEMLFLSRDLQQLPCIFAGLSEYAKPLYPKMGFKLFSFPRYVFLFRNRIIVEHSNKIPKFLKKPVSLMLDFLQGNTKIQAYKRITHLKRSFRVEHSDKIPTDIETLIYSHSTPYQELHNQHWFHYVLNYTFEEDKDESIRNKKIYLVKEKDKMIGFFVIRYRNSHVANGSWSNLRSAEIKEWESIDYDLLSEADIYHLAIAEAKKERVDSVAFSVFYTNTENIIGNKFKRQGTYDVAVYIPGKKKTDSIYERNNWRIRDGYSDTLID